jgi:hypothetical protein
MKKAASEVATRSRLAHPLEGALHFVINQPEDVLHVGQHVTNVLLIPGRRLGPRKEERHERSDILLRNLGHRAGGKGQMQGIV